MDGLSLLDRARFAGLKVRADGNQLVVRGRRSQERLARELLAHKVEVMAELDREQSGPWPKETLAITADIFGVQTVADLMATGTTDPAPGVCYACGGGAWWRLRGASLWICTRCHPPSPPPREIESRSTEEGRSA